MTFQTWLTHPAIQALGWALLHFIWQGALLAAVFFLANIITQSARTRYLTGCVVMLLMPAAFIATTLRSERPPVRSVQYAGTPSSDIEAPDTAAQAGPERRAIARPFTIATPPYRLNTIPGWIACLWLAGVAALSIFTATGWFRVLRLKRSGAEPVNSAWFEAMEILRSRLQISKPVRLCVSAIAEVPTVIGWIRPRILLPVSALTGLDEPQLRAILAHELAHIRRYDYLLNLLQNAVETLLFYHPAVWWVSRQIREERERCCDDLAVEACGDVMVYAGALAQLEELRGSAPGPALAATGGNLLARIQRLTGPRHDRPANRIAASFCALTTATLLITVAIDVGHAPAIHAQSPAPKIVQTAPAKAPPAPPIAPVEMAQLPQAPVPKPAPAPAARPEIEASPITPAEPNQQAVTSIITVLDDGRTQLTIHNYSSVPITAYAVDTAWAVDADEPALLTRSTWLIDSVLSPGVSQRTPRHEPEAPIAPGGEVSLIVAQSDDHPLVTLHAALFADGTSYGESDWITRLQNRRVYAVQALNDAVSDTEALAPTAANPADLAAKLEEQKKARIAALPKATTEAAGIDRNDLVSALTTRYVTVRSMIVGGRCNLTTSMPDCAKAVAATVHEGVMARNSAAQ